jgi:hypothetical protein
MPLRDLHPVPAHPFHSLEDSETLFSCRTHGCYYPKAQNEGFGGQTPIEAPNTTLSTIPQHTHLDFTRFSFCWIVQDFVGHRGAQFYA